MHVALHRGLWSTTGVICIVLGIIGVILPIMPGLIFFVLAILCFMECSHRFRIWMEGQYWFTKVREILHRYRPRRHKRYDGSKTTTGASK